MIGGMTTDDTFTATVRALAVARQMTHADVAAAVDIPTSTFDRRLAKGGWTISEGARLAELFGVSIDELTTGRVTLVPADG